ncbi:AzlC family ABC transporter permease [Corynebacterium sp. ACRPH]|uniref:AzlC family ABC transporter permease n=1 Tax=Corynebacterium sp. ACRPH TaxID=2918199 RepID=UPI001EF1F5F3|nr:AzlC family ABC transporter permease [Corynebacterium sp. ACRPH]MCG7456663.1 AzlC family ABC transporter permease [Corynebacterium sp. ACRPH]
MAPNTTRHARNDQWRAGIADAWPVALGMVPLGLAFGLLITQVGFAWWWAPIFSFVIYAGSMEFLAVSLVTGGVGPLSAALYGFLVNFRHAFYALNYPIAQVRGWLAKAYGIYALTDETYAILAARRDAKWSTARVMAVQILLQIGWVGGGLLGALFGSALPFEIQGMEFALIALFTVLAIEAFVSYKDLSLPIVAALCGAVGLLVSPDNMLMIGMSLYFVSLIVRFLCPPLDRALRLKVGAENAASRKVE